MKDQQQQAMLYRAETAVNSAFYSRPKIAKLFAQSGPYSEERIWSGLDSNSSFFLMMWFFLSAEHSYFLLKSTEIASFQHILKSGH